MGEYVMSRSPVYSLVLVFLLIGMLGLVVKAPEVEATIYIKANGSIDLQLQISPLLNVIYFFSGNVMYTCIT